MPTADQESYESMDKVKCNARAICSFESGEERTLYATGFSMSHAELLSVRPPPLGTRLKITLHPFGLEPLPPLECVVVEARLDPADATTAGFKVSFTHMDDDAFEALSGVVLSFSEEPTPPEEPVLVERRAAPRVRTHLEADVELGGATCSAVVQNLSTSGALLVLERSPAELGAVVDATLTLRISDEGGALVSPLSAEVARVAMDGSNSIGVRFIGQSEDMATRIEQVILGFIGAWPD